MLGLFLTEHIDQLFTHEVALQAIQNIALQHFSFDGAAIVTNAIPFVLGRRAAILGRVDFGIPATANATLGQS